MLIDNSIYVLDFVYAISEVLDLAFPSLHNHHNVVTQISYHLARRLGLSDQQTRDIVLAAMLHDIGLLYQQDNPEWDGSIDSDSYQMERAELGYKLLRNIESLAKTAQIIRYYPIRYASLTTVPLGSQIIYLANYVARQISDQQDIFLQLPSLVADVRQRQQQFNPEVLAAFDQLVQIVFVWVEFSPSYLKHIFLQELGHGGRLVGLKALRNFAKVFAQIIDARSRFTATHSSGVATVARELTLLAGFSQREAQLMEVAGYLHDLGKLAVPNSILENTGALDAAERHVMRRHPYYTYRILSRISGLESIAPLAALHHERLDGHGYPFNIQGVDFSRLSQIMAVADILTALTEDRPYRLGMSKTQAIDILTRMVADGGIDAGLVHLVVQNFPRLNAKRRRAQNAARRAYEAFCEVTSSDNTAASLTAS